MSTSTAVSVSVSASAPWHAGELTLQARAGVQDKMREVGRRVVRPFLTEQHQAFFPLLPMIAAGVVTPEGRPWATLLFGRPGFMRSVDPRTLHVATSISVSDPAASGFLDGAGIGLLGIELSTRRRNRLNGVVLRMSTSGFDVAVAQSFGNCHRYIQSRAFRLVREPGRDGEDAIAPESTTHMTPRAMKLVSTADTFFVASFVEDEEGRRHVDVSHRGGRAGFVRIDPQGTLTVPEFAGNRFFNTLGNLLVNPKAGLLFADFETGDLLQLSGRVEVDLESPDIAGFEGAERSWRFTPEEVVFRERAAPVLFEPALDFWSPATSSTGDWATAAANRGADASTRLRSGEGLAAG